MNAGAPVTPEAARSSQRPFPWAEAMAFGFGVLRLAPAAFWSMTPRELAAAVEAVRGRPGAAPPARSDFEALMHAFPDIKE